MVILGLLYVYSSTNLLIMVQRIGESLALSRTCLKASKIFGQFGAWTIVSDQLIVKTHVCQNTCLSKHMFLAIHMFLFCEAAKTDFRHQPLSKDLSMCHCLRNQMCMFRVEVLCHDINVHVPHHVSPKIPWYNLRKATDSLRQNWGEVSNPS
jgi:fatty acid desaturase